MPDSDDTLDPLPDPADLEDGETEAAPLVVDSADFIAPTEANAELLAPRESRGEVESEISAKASTPTGGNDNPVLRKYEADVHDTIVELRRIETDIRAMIQERDPVRKRKFTGTSRWQELEDDLINWRFTGRFEEETLRRVLELIGRRHYLFRHLGYLSSTRPVWNS